MTVEKLRTLPNLGFREAVLGCHACFREPATCWHHEDVVGGFAMSDAGFAARTGRVVVVGVNPQASPGDRVYQAIRDADAATKMRLGDTVLDVYAGRQRFEHIDPAWTWMNAEHRGVTEWLPRFSDLFGLTAISVADHVTFVETFKHATADQGGLSRLDEWKLIKKACPDLLHEQLRRLRPRLVVLCGGPARTGSRASC